MSPAMFDDGPLRVALPTEGVDRNQVIKHIVQRSVSRPPHGGRG